jgi:two-component system invasion response regulator UvrY
MNNQSNLGFLLVDDHSLVLQICEQLIHKNFPNAKITVSTTIEDFINTSKQQKFDMIIMDLYLQDGNSINVFNVIKVLQDTAKFLFFSMYPDNVYGKRLLQMGADGYLNKAADSAEFLKAIDIILQDGKYLSQNLRIALAQDAIDKREKNPFDQLAEREFEILLLLLSGKSISEISIDLNLHLSTVSTYKARLFSKLNVKSVIELNQLAYTYGLIH